jgi:2-keto-3-deoxy-L-rhamnonate aldolase RhmA
MSIVKDMLKAGKTAIGTSASLSSPVAFLADAGFDFIFFDTQHSPVGIKELRPQIQAMRGRYATPIIRVGGNDTALICYALDIGAKGIIIPMVNSREEVINAVRSCKYQPEGIRSAAGMRGDWGVFKRGDFGEYASAVNKGVLTLPMIETVEALNNLDEILSVPGVDVALIGPLDLSISMGIPADFLNPKYQETLDEIVRACKKAGVAPGIYNIPGGQDPNDFIARGFRIFTLPWNQWATNGVKNALAKIKR